MNNSIKEKEKILLNEIIDTLISLNNCQNEDTKSYLLASIQRLDLIKRTHDIYKKAQEGGRSTQVNALYLLVIISIKIDKFHDAVNFAVKLQQLNEKFQEKLSYIFNYKILQIQVSREPFLLLNEHIAFIGICRNFELLDGVFIYNSEKSTHLDYVENNKPLEASYKTIVSSFNNTSSGSEYTLEKLCFDLNRTLEMGRNYLPSNIPSEIIDYDKISQVIRKALFTRSPKDDSWTYDNPTTISLIASLLPNNSWLDECMLKTNNVHILNCYYLSILRIPNCDKNYIALTIFDLFDKRFFCSRERYSEERYTNNFRSYITQSLINALTDICTPLEFITENLIINITKLLDTVQYCNNFKKLVEVLSMNIVKFYFKEKNFVECDFYLKKYAPFLKPYPLLSTCSNFFVYCDFQAAKIIHAQSDLQELSNSGQKLVEILKAILKNSRESGQKKLSLNVINTLKTFTIDYLVEIKKVDSTAQQITLLDSITYSMLWITYLLKQMNFIEDTEIPKLNSELVEKLIKILEDNQKKPKLSIIRFNAVQARESIVVDFKEFLTECALIKNAPNGVI